MKLKLTNSTALASFVKGSPEVKDFPYRMKGECIINIDKAVNESIAKASLNKLKSLIPDVDSEKNVDLLPVAFNAFVVNRINKNDDIMDIKTALEVAPTFLNKPINVEHNRAEVVGVITSYSFSEFGTDDPLTEEQVKEIDEGKPFNVVLGGVLWRKVSSVPEIIEETNDPKSDLYEAVSASWEIGLSEYTVVVLPAGEKNLSEATFVQDEELLSSLAESLRVNGGDGFNDSGQRVYRMAVGKDVLGLGIGLTTDPAAEVKGVAVKDEEESSASNKRGLIKGEGRTTSPLSEEDLSGSEIVSSIVSKSSNHSNNLNNISQIDKQTVKKNRLNMKIDKIAQITDESLKDLKASEVTDFLEQEIKLASEKYAKNKREEEDLAEASRKEKEESLAEVKEIQDKHDLLASELKELKAAEAARAQDELFQARMVELNDIYELGESEKGFIASRLKNCDEDSYESYKEELEVFLASKNKESIKVAAEELAAAKKGSDKTDKTVEVSDKEAKASVESDADEIKKELKDAKANKSEETIPNGGDQTEESLKDRYRTHFKLDKENYNIKS